MADPNLELRGEEGEDGGGGGGAVLIFLPCWPFSLQSFLLFLLKIRGGGGGPPLDSPLLSVFSWKPAQPWYLKTKSLLFLEA